MDRANSMDSTPNNDAKTLFRMGVECEREGDLFEATRYYKRALKLDPDVEKLIAEEDAASRSMDTTNESSESEDEYDQKEDLYVRFQRLLGPETCVPEHAQRATHFSNLPTELVLYIFRWVVSSDLDVRTLEQCTAVCRGWYLCARDPELWRRACGKIWNPNSNDLATHGGSWRQMFITRPHVLTTGCYIWKFSYVRQGEESFRDNSNGQYYHNVCYYRYLRFFPDGRVIMVRTPNPPNVIVRKLKTREKAPFNVSPGFYQLHGNKVYLTLDSEDHKRPETMRKYGYEQDPKRKTIYRIVLELHNYKSRYNWKLKCLDYEIVYQYLDNVMVSKLDLTTNQFPSFYFSRVKSYSAHSEYIL